MTVSKLINLNYNDFDIFNDEDYPGKIPNHMISNRVENYKLLYNYINDENINIFEECNKQISPFTNEDIDSIYSNDEDIIEEDINDTQDDIKSISSYFSESMSDVQTLKDPKIKSNIITNEIIQLNDLSKSELIKNQKEQIRELKKKVPKKSENLEKFIEYLSNNGKDIMHKKYIITTYSKSVNIIITNEDLDDLTDEEFDKIYKLVEKIKLHKSSFDITSTLIKLLLAFLEKILVDYMNAKIFIGISDGISDEFIDSKIKITKEFINNKTSIPEYPFIDIIMHISSVVVRNLLSNKCIPT